MTERRHFSYRIATEGLALTAAMWVVLVGFALWHDGTRWPRPTNAIGQETATRLGVMPRPAIGAVEAWENFGTLALIVELFLMLAWVSWRQKNRLDWLGGALIATFVAIAAVFLWSMAAVLFGWHTTPEVRRFVLRGPVIAAAALAFVNLCRTPDGPAVAVGPRGPRGRRGPRGVRGNSGETGQTGQTGQTGIQGPPGPAWSREEGER
jgi:hypothetical protein